MILPLTSEYSQDEVSVKVPDFYNICLKIPFGGERFVVKGPTLLSASVEEIFVEKDGELSVVDADAHGRVGAEDKKVVFASPLPDLKITLVIEILVLFGDIMLCLLRILGPLNECVNQCDQKKIAKCLQKLPKNDFTRKMVDFDNFTKNA